MVQIAGKYKVESSENFVEYLKAIGIPEENASKGNDFAKDLEIIVDGNKYTLKNDFRATTFTLGEEFDETLPGGPTTNSVATLDGNKLVIKSKNSDGASGERVYDFNNGGMTVTLRTSAASVVGKRTYKRI